MAGQPLLMVRRLIRVLPWRIERDREFHSNGVDATTQSCVALIHSLQRFAGVAVAAAGTEPIDSL